MAINLILIKIYSKYGENWVPNLIKIGITN